MINMIAILLATYNSERFLKDQLSSIFGQSFHEWKLIIRDDGSTDNTISIINEYKKQYPDKVFLLKDERAGLRAYMNFVTLLKNACADYYMFCDHDDVWLKDKISISIKRMKEIESKYPDKPVVVHTDMKVVDQDLNVISESFWKYSRFLPGHTDFWELVCCNCVNGCTMLFNQKAKDTIYGHEPYCLMHDTLVAQSTAAAGGIISAVNKATVLYRQHVDNVIGAANAKRYYFIGRLETINKTLRINHEVWERACNINKIAFSHFLLIKTKITILRFFRR